MTHFVVAGMLDCCMFNHVKLIANILTDRLPNFKANIIQLEVHEWKAWLKEKNVKNGWYHLTSPIVWKEFTLRGGKAHLIGGASEFWEYCYDYYNLECLLEKQELYKLVADTKQHNDSRKKIEAKKEAEKQKIKIFITSNRTTSNIVVVVLMRLIVRVKLFYPRQIIIRILKSDDIIDDVNEISVFQAKFELVDSIKQGLDDTDLLLVIGDYSREIDEDMIRWLLRNKVAMESLADQINETAKQSLRVIVAINGPVCFCTAILLENVTKIHLYNIVAETSNVGLEPLSLVAKITQMPLEDMSGPPIWGFIGINHIIDLEHIVQRYDVYRPNVRAVKNTYGSTLQLGKKHTEFRYLSYMSDKLKTVWVKLKQKRDKAQYLYHVNRLAKARSIMTLLENWYFPHLFDHDHIMSLGILTNGSFGLPSGIVFSQPAILKDDRWVPMKTFPVPRRDPCSIEDLIPCTLEIYRYFQIRDLFLDP